MSIVGREARRDAVGRMAVEVRDVLFIEPSGGQPGIGGLLEGGSRTVAESEEEQFLLGFRGEEAFGGPGKAVAVANAEGVTLRRPELLVGSEEEGAGILEGLECGLRLGLTAGCEGQYKEHGGKEIDRFFHFLAIWE